MDLTYTRQIKQNIFQTPENANSMGFFFFINLFFAFIVFKSSIFPAISRLIVCICVCVCIFLFFFNFPFYFSQEKKIDFYSL